MSKALELELNLLLTEYREYDTLDGQDADQILKRIGKMLEEERKRNGRAERL